MNGGQMRGQADVRSGFEGMGLRKDEAVPSQVIGVQGCRPWKICENLYANLCILTSKQLTLESSFCNKELQMLDRFRVWYKSDINFWFYAAILDFGMLAFFLRDNF
jgi:hypothetical protein